MLNNCNESFSAKPFISRVTLSQNRLPQESVLPPPTPPMPQWTCRGPFPPRGRRGHRARPFRLSQWPLRERGQGPQAPQPRMTMQKTSPRRPLSRKVKQINFKGEHHRRFITFSSSPTTAKSWDIKHWIPSQFPLQTKQNCFQSSLSVCAYL